MIQGDSIQDARTYASEAGCQFAAVLVMQKADLRDVTAEQLETFRRRYRVPKWQMPTFIAACRAAIPFERSWQYHPD